MPIILPSPPAASGGPGSIVDYASLQTTIAGWLHRSDLTSVIPDFIQFGENRIYRDCRVRQMEATFSSAISSGTIALPTGYLELKNAYVDQTPVQALQKKDSEWIYACFPTRSSDGLPRYIAREGETMIFGPYPDSNYTIKGSYYKKLTALSGSNTTNWLTDDYPDLILFASLCQAAPYIRDDARIALWEQKYSQIVEMLKTNDSNEDFSGSPLSITSR